MAIIQMIIRKNTRKLVERNEHNIEARFTSLLTYSNSRFNLCMQNLCLGVTTGWLAVARNIQTCKDKRSVRKCHQRISSLRRGIQACVKVVDSCDEERKRIAVYRWVVFSQARTVVTEVHRAHLCMKRATVPVPHHGRMVVRIM